MQICRSTSTMPSARLNEAPVGQTSTQGGYSQCWHITGTELVWPLRISFNSTLRIHCASVRGCPVSLMPFSVAQALTQSSQPGRHLLVSINRPQRQHRPAQGGCGDGEKPAPAEAVVRVCAHGFAPLATFGLEAWQPKQSSLTLA